MKKSIIPKPPTLMKGIKHNKININLKKEIEGRNLNKSELKKKYEKQLKELESMGFTNLSENIWALHSNQGNIENSLNSILNGTVNVPEWLDEEEEVLPEISLDETEEMEQGVWRKLFIENCPKERIGFTTVLYKDKVFIYGSTEGKN